MERFKQYLTESNKDNYDAMVREFISIFPKRAKRTHKLVKKIRLALKRSDRIIWFIKIALLQELREIADLNLKVSGRNAMYVQAGGNRNKIRKKQTKKRISHLRGQQKSAIKDESEEDSYVDMTYHGYDSYDIQNEIEYYQKKPRLVSKNITQDEWKKAGANIKKYHQIRKDRQQPAKELITKYMKKWGLGEYPKNVRAWKPGPWLRDLKHYFDLNIPAINDYIFIKQMPDEVITHFRQIEQAWTVKGETSDTRYLLEEGDKFLNIDGRWAWYWVNEREFDKEKLAMRNCGRDQRSHRGVLSLREKVKLGFEASGIMNPKKQKGRIGWKPHLNFTVLTDGSLGEMKGWANAKPDSKFHKYIIKLLQDKRIKGITGGGYLPDNNFDLGDLRYEDIQKINQSNPQILNHDAMLGMENDNL